jgi:Ca2+-binding EF-hand superfamily protein
MLIRKTFKFVSIRKIKKNIFLRIFAKIDTNNDGLISINSYLDWIKRYLSVEINRGEEYYLTQDDANIEGYDII